MNHAFIMDPLATVKPWKDTSYFLMLAASERGHQVCHLDQRDLSLRHDQLYATVTWVVAHDSSEQPFEVVKQEEVAMADMDVVWLRTDPPFDRRYFYTTLFLDRLPARVKVVNQPQGVRNWNEKLAALELPEWTPQTLVSNNPKAIAEFAKQQGRLTIKPVDGFGGKGIFFFESGGPVERLSEATHQGAHWVIAQEYLPAATEGDKRILLVNGEPIGAILRVHADGVELNNLDAGGEARAVNLDDNDRAICAALAPKLRDQGAFFVGIDVIGGKLIEVNVTSPTGLQELSRFSGVAHHHNIIELLEQ